MDDIYEGEPIKVASVRDLLLLKVWAVAECPEPTKRMRGQTDVVELLVYNADKITAATTSMLVGVYYSLVTPQRRRPNFSNLSLG